jgi:hypothetical protein
MTKTREVDEFGNVSYVIREGSRVLGRLHRQSSSYHLCLPSGSCVYPLASIKSAMDWLVKFGQPASQKETPR